MNMSTDHLLNHLIHIREEHGEHLQLLRRIMGKLNDISTALTALSTAVSAGFTTLTTDLTTLLTDLGADGAQIDAIVKQVTDIGTSIQSAVDGLDSQIKAADPGPPPPPK